MRKFWNNWKLSLVIILSLVCFAELGVLLSFKLSADTENHTITLTDDGFYPSEITIGQGEVVKFVTKRDKEFWPASNLHPTHEIYPEFDSKKPIKPEKGWNFQFDKAGRWRYHDHLFANATGKIIVLDEKGNAPPTAADNCLAVADSGKQQCWDEQLETTLETEGFDAAFELFVDLYRTDPEIPKGCHGWGHILGEAAFELYVNQKDFILREEASYCGYGFYHGLVEEFFLMTGDVEAVRTFCEYISTKLSSDRRAGTAYTNCIHGTGHGAVVGVAEDPTRWETLQDIIDVGIKVCESFTDIPSEIDTCLEGVYVGAIVMLNLNEYGFSFDLIKDDFFWICRAQEEEYKRRCYIEFIGIIFSPEFAGRDFNKAINMIMDEVSDPNLRKEMVTKATAGYMQDEIVKPSHDENLLACRRLEATFYKPCFEGILRAFSAHGEPKNEHIKGFNFCRSKLLSPEEKDNCYRKILGMFNSYKRSPEERQQVCQEIEEEYRKHCS